MPGTPYGPDEGRLALRETRAFLGSNATCMRCKERRSAHVVSRGGRREALCSTCAEGKTPVRSRGLPRAADPNAALRRSQRRAEAMMPLLGLQRSSLTDGELAYILGKIKETLGSDSAKFYDVLAQAGINKDDFQSLVSQLGIELDAQ